MNRPWGVLQLVRGDAWKAIPEVRDAILAQFWRNICAIRAIL